MKQAGSKSLLSVILTALVIGLLIFLGPANAVTVSVSTPTNALSAGEVVSFIAEVDIEANERLPITNISVEIVDGSSVLDTCYFDIDGNILSECDSRFQSVSLLSNSAVFSNGSLSGEGFGTNSSFDDDATRSTFFGYGYGYGYFSSSNELQYNITYKTPNILGGTFNYDVVVKVNSEANTVAYEYKEETTSTITVERSTEDIENNLDLEVNEIIENGVVLFSIDYSSSLGERRTLKVRPTMTCLGIQYDLNDRYLDEELILEDEQTYELEVDVSDFDLSFPYSINCEFNVILEEEEFGSEITLTEQVTFEDEVTLAIQERNSANTDPTNTTISGELNNGIDLTGYIYSFFDKEFSSGFNTVNFQFRNDGNEDIGVEMRITVADLFIDQFQSFDVESNTDRTIVFPLFIDEDLEPGMYPVRFSYRINEGELKTKYGYIKVE